MKSFYQQLIDNNRVWASGKLSQDPEYFSKLAEKQKPPVLWIGCADSRVPANEITGTQPGDIFVHRNIANMVVPTDMNMLSVLEYAVTVLKVKHIIVCGHYGCGGVQAAMTDDEYGIADGWIRHIKDVYRLHRNELEQIKDFDQRYKRLVELNVIEQVSDLAKTPIVRKALKERDDLELHGWVYGLDTGLVKDLGSISKRDSDLLRELAEVKVTLPDFY